MSVSLSLSVCLGLGVCTGCEMAREQGSKGVTETVDWSSSLESRGGEEIGKEGRDGIGGWRA